MSNAINKTSADGVGYFRKNDRDRFGFSQQCGDRRSGDTDQDIRALRDQILGQPPHAAGLAGAAAIVELNVVAFHPAERRQPFRQGSCLRPARGVVLRPPGEHADAPLAAR